MSGPQQTTLALYLWPLNDTFAPKRIALAPQQRVKIGRQTNSQTVPTEGNGYFDSKILSRQHSEVWEQDGKIYIKDVKSSNGTFINGKRLSGEGLESEPFQLKSGDIVEFGINITDEDGKTIMHKATARVLCILNEQDAQATTHAEQQQLTRNPSGHTLSSHHQNSTSTAGPSNALNFDDGMGDSMLPPENSGFTLHYILNRSQGELQRSRETGAELQPPNDCVSEIHDALGGMKELRVQSQNSLYKEPIQAPVPSTVHPVPDSSIANEEEVGIAQSFIDMVHERNPIMTEDTSTPPSRVLTRRLRSLIANLDVTSVEPTAKQVCKWFDSSKNHDDHFRGLLRLSSELILEKAVERPEKEFHRVLGHFCKIIDTTTDGEHSRLLTSLWKQEVHAAGVELTANDTAETGSWPEYVALVAFAGELCDEVLSQPDVLCSYISMLGSAGSNLGLELACTLIEATGHTLRENHNGKQHFDAAIQAMLSASRGDGICVRIRHRVQKLAARSIPGCAPPSDNDEAVQPDAGEEPSEGKTAPQLCKPRHPEFYFESGDIVFVCEDTSFRVQSDLLSNNSQVFADMLEPLRSSGERLSGGCPCVHLSDAAKDFATLLRVFYTPGFPHRRKTPDFTTFSLLLRMATKYQFQEIRSQILLDLLPAYPTSFSEYKTSSRLGEMVFGTPPPHPNLVLNLFVTHKVAFALPFTYYRASMASDPTSLATTAEELTLPPDVLKVALRGQALLKTDEVELAKRLALQDCPTSMCLAVHFPDCRAQFLDWILPTVSTRSGILEREDFSGPGYCDQCLQSFAQELSEAKEDTWKQLPLYFSLPPWKTLAGL